MSYVSTHMLVFTPRKFSKVARYPLLQLWNRTQRRAHRRNLKPRGRKSFLRATQIGPLNQIRTSTPDKESEQDIKTPFQKKSREKKSFSSQIEIVSRLTKHNRWQKLNSCWQRNGFHLQHRLHEGTSHHWQSLGAAFAFDDSWWHSSSRVHFIQKRRTGDTASTRYQSRWSCLTKTAHNSKVTGPRSISK